MGDQYRTVFEVSYFTNGALLKSAFFLAIGLGVLAAALTGRLRLRERGDGGCSQIGVGIWCVVWIAFSLVWVGSNLLSAWEFTHALQNGECETTEGTVEVLHRQPATGHAPGDRIRVGSREFQFNYFHGTLAYRETIAHGGALTQGRRVRLHDWKGNILKVEVAR